MATYKSSYTGPQIDQAVGNALNKDNSTLSDDVNHIPASSVVKSALDNIVGKYNASAVISSAHTVDGFFDVIGRDAKVAVFTATITLTSNVGAWSTFANIQLPPAINMNVVCFVGNAIERVFISSGGNVQLSTGHSTGDIIALNFAYAL